MIEAHVWGDDKAKPPLLLIHGMLTSAKHWLINKPDLTQHFTVIAVDMPGHGSAPAPKDPSVITPSTLIDAFEELRNRLGYDRWFIAGQSFGGALSLNYALHRPGSVIANVFTNARTPLRDYSNHDEIAGRSERLELLRRKGHAALQQEFFHPRNARRFPPELCEMLVAEADRIDIGCYIQLLDQVIPALSLWPLLENQPKVPTLLINGRHERLFQDYRVRVAQAWPELEVVDIDGGHSVNVENPSEFAAALIEFCKRHAS